MTASATSRNIRSIMRHPNENEPLNILTFTTHERYEHNLCRTGHNFYALNVGAKTWDTDYATIPDNYHIINEIPEYLDIDLILSHTSCERLQIAHDYLSQTQNSKINSKIAIPILRHTHVLPDIRINIDTQKQIFQSIPVNKNSFISTFNRDAWGYDEINASVVQHGVDTDFWKPAIGVSEKNNTCLSVVNDWPNRDWCCGFNLWKHTIDGLPALVVGKSPGFSVPAKSTEHLREIYQQSSIFYNTSLHSPVPTVMLEAMACGCAIVSTATCMIPEIIQHGENGLISNDAQELRSFLEMLLNDQELTQKLSYNARKTIEQKYNLDIFIEQWNRLLYSTIRDYKEQA